MGRPLKIAKAQAVLTVTATSSAGVVTVTDNLTVDPTVGVAAGMPFIMATTTGGLTAGVTYYILAITGNHTFTVSSTELSVQPQVSPSMSNAGPVTVAATVGLVDYSFSNPDGSNTATNSTTYGVVGGNTALYGSQTLAAVAIGVNGAGNVYSLTSSADVWGVNSDFANAAGLAAGSAIQIVNPVTGSATDIGFVSSLYRFDANVTNTYANGYVKCDDNSGFNSNKPVYLQGNIGGLVANTPYFVTTIDGGGELVTLSTQPSGPNVALTAASGTVPVVAEALTLTTNATANSGVDNTTYFSSYVYANDEAGYIVRQKGKTKYLVTGSVSGLTGVCYTANVANTALTPNTMNIVATYTGPSTKYVSSLNDYQSEVFPAQVAAGSLVANTVYTVYSSGDTNWTAVGAASNITGVTFTATGAGSGTGTAVLNTVNPDVIATFGTAYAANTYGGQPNPIVTISNA